MMAKYPSTLLPQDNTPQENQKAVLDLLSKLNAVDNDAQKAINQAKTDIDKDISGEISKTQNGYIKFPGGLILQWGEETALSALSGTSTIVTFPVQFPNSCAIALAQNTGTVQGVSTYNITQRLLASFTAQRSNVSNLDTGKTFVWFALGF